MFVPGDRLIGITKRHSGRIVIVKVCPNAYRYRTRGGHSKECEGYLRKPIVERNFVKDGR